MGAAGYESSSSRRARCSRVTFSMRSLWLVARRSRGPRIHGPRPRLTGPVGASGPTDLSSSMRAEDSNLHVVSDDLLSRRPTALEPPCPGPEGLLGSHPSPPS